MQAPFAFEPAFSPVGLVRENDAMPRPPPFPIGQTTAQPGLDVAQLFNQGLALHRQGQLAQAKLIYAQVLEQDPAHVDAQHLSGVIALQGGNAALALDLIDRAIGANAGNAAAYSNRGIALHELRRFEEAVASYDRAIAIKPDYAEAHSNRGNSLKELGRLDEAVASYDRAIAIKPDEAQVFFNRGIALHDLKRLEEAVTSYDKAVAIDPGHAEACYRRGNALQEWGRVEEALASYDRAIALKPGFAEAFSNRGVALHELKRVEDAVASYDMAISIKPDYAEALSNRGIALHELKRVEEALASYDKAIAIKPDYPEACYCRGNALYELRRVEEALASYDMAIAARPDFAEAHSNRGAALQELKRVEEAVASYDRAIAIKPDHAKAYSNRGVALKKLGRVEEAIASYDRAIAIQPGYAEAHSNRGIALYDSRRMEEAIASHDKAIAARPDYAEAYFNKALALLLTGDLVRGCELYEWRWKVQENRSRNRNFPQPLWLGHESIEGKTILLHAEQGLGDTIQFSRYAKLVKALGARVVLEVPRPLVGLLGGMEGVDELLEQGQPLTGFDCHCPLMSLPLAFKTDLASIPRPGPYLAAPPKKLDEWAQRLGAKGKPRVGVMWSGSTVHKNDHNRSLALQQLLPHLPERCEYVSLQKDVREVDRPVLAASGIRHYGDELRDFTDTAALCELMDVVISVDTSVAHLAGALGQRTWILLPHAPDWRWLLDRDDSPWYESVRLYRQDRSMEWLPVLLRMGRDLEDHVLPSPTAADASRLPAS